MKYYYDLVQSGIGAHFESGEQNPMYYITPVFGFVRRLKPIENVFSRINSSCFYIVPRDWLEADRRK